MIDNPAGNNEIIIRTEEISKMYPGTLALDRVNYDVYRGKVNVLIGANGAGKSTLMKILAGIEKQSSGSYLLEGKEVNFKSPRDATEQGIAIIHQELNLFSNMNIAENIFANREITKNKVHINHREQERLSAELLDKLELHVSPRTLVGDLRVGQQQIIEIAKALSKDINVLIMDEPTSALSKDEVRVLFRMIRELKKQNITIIYISHRLEELMQIGDKITVLRDGVLVANGDMKKDSIDLPWIVRHMVGNKASNLDYTKHSNIGEEILKVKSLSMSDQSGKKVINDISFTLNRGEVLGFYGLLGAGRTEFLECLLGLHPNVTGEVYLEGRLLKETRIDKRIEKGIILVPEDRQREGLFQNMSIANNMTLSSLKKYRDLFQLNSKKEDSAVESKIRELGIKVGDKRNLITSLSGGNQQKVVIGKGLLTAPKVLLMDETTRGIDVKAKNDVFTIMNTLANEGLSIIFVSTEIDEIMKVSDRILVFSNGELTGTFARDNVSPDDLVAASSIGHSLS